MENTTNLSLPKEKLERDPVKTVILASMMGTAIEFLIFMHTGLLQRHIFRPFSSRRQRRYWQPC